MLPGVLEDATTWPTALALSEGKGKPWETKPVITRKPRQGRHFGLTHTNVAHYLLLAC